jgi:pimeloyl-ACP methyl ester carboxylesterase
LHFFLEGLAVSRARPFAIVAHSTGGLVAALYAQRHREWQERIQRAVFLGVPLRGTFAPVQVSLGQHPLLTKLDLLNLASLDELATSMRSFPGLMQLLPDPVTFAAQDLYLSGTWPERTRPTQALLDEARNTKALVRESPLLDRSALIVSLTRPTIDGLIGGAQGGDAWQLGRQTGAGDGTVPARSAVIEGRDVAAVDEDHVFLPTSRDVHRAVHAILTSGAFPADLRWVPGAGDLERKLAEPAPFAQQELGGLGDPLARARSRLERELDWATLRWLLDSNVSALAGESG